MNEYEYIKLVGKRIRTAREKAGLNILKQMEFSEIILEKEVNN